ncbi:polyphenol oxidase family protein [Kocuria palustris]|uniref:polyphenol oxidase family protein n=1 Tax=Kocuria palustris TaxID=71999 RepID=UPI00045E8649|nr:polyphenol oxidase family protein [Kocuria palustris]MDH5150611.1 polyphenol oxidase family protein [Kocuria palustris]
MYWHSSQRLGVRTVFTDRDLGNLGLHVPDDPQAVRARRDRAAIDLGVDPASVLYLDQVHGTHVVDADAAAPGEVCTGDAAVSTAGRPLAVMVADCVPVVLVGEPGRASAAPLTAVAHAGRRGLLDGVLPAVVEALRARGAQRISAQIGPCVCAQCYEVPEQMAEESEQSLPGIRTTTRWGTPGLDLPGAAARQLEQLGVQVEVVAEDSPRCTLENEGLSSHRRDPSSGRIAGIVVPVS